MKRNYMESKFKLLADMNQNQFDKLLKWRDEAIYDSLKPTKSMPKQEKPPEIQTEHQKRLAALKADLLAPKQVGGRQAAP
jgi:succinate dehydrogenase flavin-adding protein (antitoxin of CptAB toxin-antitoxin module)